MVTTVTSGRYGTKARIVGANQLAKTLRDAGVDMEHMKAENLKCAEIVASRARQLVPVRSGRLQKSIRAGATNRVGVVRAGYNRRLDKYAGPIHWGWNGNGVRVTSYKNRTERKTIKPTYFLSNAARRTQSQWLKIYKKAVDQAIMQVKGA